MMCAEIKGCPADEGLKAPTGNLTRFPRRVVFQSGTRLPSVGGGDTHPLSYSSIHGRVRGKQGNPTTLAATCSVAGRQTVCVAAACSFYIVDNYSSYSHTLVISRQIPECDTEASRQP